MACFSVFTWLCVNMIIILKNKQVCWLAISCSSFPAERKRCSKLGSSKLAMDPIEISSSDSETEVEDSGRNGTGQDRRVLPPWGSSSTSGVSTRKPG